MLTALIVATIIQGTPGAPDMEVLAGTYELSQMEMGGGLVLWPDGRFRYMLDYGNVSEAAEGRWSIEGGNVRLTSKPMNPEVLHDMERNDARFAGQLLRIDGDTLVMERYDTRMFFRRVQP